MIRVATGTGKTGKCLNKLELKFVLAKHAGNFTFLCFQVQYWKFFENVLKSTWISNSISTCIFMKMPNFQIVSVVPILTALSNIWVLTSPFYILLELTTEFAHCRQGMEQYCLYLLARGLTQTYCHIKFVWIINNYLNLVWCFGIHNVIFLRRPYLIWWIQKCNPVL